MISTPAEAAVRMLDVENPLPIVEVCARWDITLAQLQDACGERDSGHTLVQEDDGTSRRCWHRCTVCGYVAEPQEGPEP